MATEIPGPPKRNMRNTRNSTPPRPQGSRMIAVSPSCPPQMCRLQTWTVHDYVLLKEIGAGAASVVYHATCKKSGMPVALKMYKKRKLGLLNVRQVEREIQIHSRIGHDNIILLYGAFEDENCIYLVLQYASGGDLFDELRRRGGRMKEQEAVRLVLVPFMKALAHLHRRGIVHRDIKPENTLFDSKKVLKIADFGLSIDSTQERPVTRLGTLDYMAPEVLICPDKRLPEDNKDNSLMQYGSEVDAWGVGVLAYEIMVGRPPFGMALRDNTMEAIMSKEPKFPKWMSEGSKEFIFSAVCKDANKRPSVMDLMQHSWILSLYPSLQPITRERCWLPQSPSKLHAAAAARPTQSRSQPVDLETAKKIHPVQQQQEEQQYVAYVKLPLSGLGDRTRSDQLQSSFTSMAVGAESRVERAAERGLSSSRSSRMSCSSSETSSSATAEREMRAEKDGSFARHLKKQLANGSYRSFLPGFNSLGKKCKGSGTASGARSSSKHGAFDLGATPTARAALPEGCQLTTMPISGQWSPHVPFIKAIHPPIDSLPVNARMAAKDRLLTGRSDAVVHIRSSLDASVRGRLTAGSTLKPTARNFVPALPGSIPPQPSHEQGL